MISIRENVADIIIGDCLSHDQYKFCTGSKFDHQTDLFNQLRKKRRKCVKPPVKNFEINYVNNTRFQN